MSLDNFCRRILCIVDEKKVNYLWISRRSGITIQTVSKKAKYLNQKGLVNVRIDGRSKFVTLTGKGIMKKHEILQECI